jgi:hypothetical protein
MNTKKQFIDIEAIFLIAVVGFVSVFWVWQSNKKTQTKVRAVSQEISINKNIPVFATPTPIPQIDIASQISSDGKMTLFMRTVHNSDASRTYTFSTSEETEKDQKTIYTIILRGSERMSVPFNTWSPDNKYFFILKNDKEAMVFNAMGEPFSDRETFWDVTTIFKQNNIEDTIDYVTGWGSESLLVVNARTKNNDLVSYWFEATSKAIIPLSTVFE